MRFPRKKYDYYLIIVTTLILFSIGLVCLYGITYYNYLSVDPLWTRTVQYTNYINDMNSLLYPFLVLLLVSLGLCIPKRLFDQDILIKFSVIALAVTLILTFSHGIEIGLGFLLLFMIGVQCVVVFLTLKKSKSIRFEREGYVIRLGSSFLHLGLVIVIINFVNFRESPSHLTIFWIGTLLVTAGNIFSFYPGSISSRFHK